MATKRVAFSLVELLVVLALIGVLVGLGAGHLSASKRRSYEVKCCSNLRQVGAAISTYADANADSPSPIIWQRDTYWDSGPQIGWDIGTGAWAHIPGGSGSIWQCPQQKTGYVGNARALGIDRRELGLPVVETVNRSRWVETARLVLAYDLQHNLLDRMYAHALNPAAGDFSDEYYAWPLSEPFVVPLYLPYFGPHGERYGVLFADGHAECGVFETGTAVEWIGPRWWVDTLRPAPPSAGRTDR